MANSNVIVAGDFRQLPPIALSRTEIVARWYARDVFEASGIVDAVSEGKDRENLVKLTTQFRSREELCRLINERFYGGDLVTRYAERAPIPFPATMKFLAEHPVVLVDSSEISPTGGIVGRSKTNLAHALIVRALCRDFSTEASPQSRNLVGVITPYRAQVELIEEVLEEAGITGIAVGTVHRFQGEERKVIVLDLTESPPHSLGSFSRCTTVRDVGARLLNVALSRAECSLVVVANLSFFAAHTHHGHLICGILADIQRSAFRLSARHLLGRSEDGTAFP
jgi:superfamily I DNA and/or RNA helicase